MNLKKALLALFFIPLLLSSTLFTKERVLVLIDIDGTLGEESKGELKVHDGKIELSHESTDFYLYPGAIDFIGHVLWNKQELESKGQPVDIALFTMGSGIRNEEIRDHLEKQFDLPKETIRVFDYSNAVFSKKVVDMWRSNDPQLSDDLKQYFDSLEKPIAHVRDLDSGSLYYKDLTNILPFYPGASVYKTMLVDDNEHALPPNQIEQLIVARPLANPNKMLTETLHLLRILTRE